MARRRAFVAVAALALVAAAASAQAGAAPPLGAEADLGGAISFDPALSGSGTMSCAVCHDSANHYAQTNDLAVQVGGMGMDQPDFRAVPTLAYKATTPPLPIGPADAINDGVEAAAIAVAETRDSSELDAANAIGKLVVAMKATTPKAGDSSAAQVARGGMFWDGRADTLQDQTLGSFLSPFDMANGDAPALAARIVASYGGRLEKVFSAQVLKDPKMTVDESAQAIARQELVDPSFHPFSSTYDACLARKATLSPVEARGLKLIDDPANGNCVACLLDKPSADGKPPLFTDFGFEALAVPHNRSIPAKADPSRSRPRALRSLANGSARRQRLRPVQDADAAQLGNPAGVLPQRGLPRSERRSPFLHPARHGPRAN